MTVESLPVENFNQDVVAGAAPIAAAGALDQRSLVFMSINVVSGAATALVVATGGLNQFGSLATHATAVHTDNSRIAKSANSGGCGVA